MTDPLALLPLRAAAGGGRIGEFEAQQLVAAGLTLLQRCAPLVRALSGRRSAILLPASPAFLTALAASDGRGAVLLNPLASPLEIATQLRDAGVGAVFTVTPLAGRLPDDMPRALLDDAPRSARFVGDGVTRDLDLGSHHGLTIEGDRDVAGRDEEAAIVYTSGMAGRPLGAVLSHRNLIANARSTVEAAGNTAHDHVLALLPFSHLFGLTVTGMAPLFAGARVTTMDRFNPARAVELISSGGITEVVGVPAVYQTLLAALHKRGAGAGRGELRLCICGGAPLDVELQEQWFQATGVELRQGYGLTEAAPVCLFNGVDRPNARGTLGVAFPAVEVSVRAPLDGPADGAECALGERGEICVRGANVFAGYVSDGARGLAVRDGWLYTGDVGTMNPNGTVVFGGVRKAMFTRNGFNIYPEEVRRAVMELAGVENAVVSAMPNAARENDIRIDVSGSVTEDEVRRWCEIRLSAYKQPTEIAVNGATAI